MSSFLDELCAYMEDQDASFIFNDQTVDDPINTFAGTYPDEPANLTALIGTTGSNIQAQRDVKELTFPRFQLVVRDLDYETAASRFETARGILHGLINVTLDTKTLMRCHAEQEGGPIGQDAESRYEFVGNFNAEYYITPES